MSDPALTPDQFLYGRKGPWTQPSPSHPLGEALEVLTIPPVETMLWNATIGQRYFKTQVGYPPEAAAKAVLDLAYTTPSDATFETELFSTAYQRYLKPLSANDRQLLASQPAAAPGAAAAGWKYDFSAMALVKPLEGMHCAPTVVYIAGAPAGSLQCVAIAVGNVVVRPADTAWGLAKIYALQGAAYHMLFVVHPALHFPMDSVNAVTKTAVPYTHPLFQLIYPHTSYTLALDNSVLESDQSVVNNHARGSWFDPLTGNAYNLKLLFAAGYAGLPDQPYADAYPAYDYMQPELLKLAGSAPSPVFDTPYSQWLTAYFQRAFLPFCRTVANAVLTADPADSYVTRWARYLHASVRGFPDERQILDPECLATALAIYLWDVTVSHGADHHSFGLSVPVVDKFLRIRRAPPATRNDPPVAPGEIFNGDDQFRAQMAQAMFFAPFAIQPNLDQTYYAFTHPLLALEQVKFHADLLAVSLDGSLTQYMPLRAAGPVDAPPYTLTIPASIQY